jgi:hypothetical protein
MRATAEQAAESLKITQAIAAHMPQWEAEPYLYRNDPEREPTNMCVLVNRTGERICLTFDGYRGRDRIAISGDYPTLPSGRYYTSREDSNPRITVSKSRDPRAIAADIQRRTVDGVCLHWQKARAEIQRQKERHQQATAAAEALNGLGFELMTRELEREQTFKFYERLRMNGARLEGDFTPYNGGKISIKIVSLRLEEAIALLAAYQAIKGS